ncbi:TORTIFOLIA1-like protein 3 [Neltuma alba]|uniref:TORTIFOLIA1-like protein 3 n=1 Tax=Neltuma alba TaxID=207710 RepID=UPI0010A4A50C|nr:TORTIFOLIA1-like protein 3 [Prosopis alba]
MAPSSASGHSLKQKVFTCLTKLSDRDTQSIAANELESIARNLDSNSVPVFLSCIHSTNSSDKSPVRKQCVHLMQVLSETHGNTLSPYLSKILAHIVRRLRDPDSSVRSACVNSVSALSAHITKQPFASFLKPLTEALFTEQDQNSQLGAALCLASAIDAAPDPDPARLAKLLPRVEKLLRSGSFKAKPALLTLIGSVIEAGGLSGHAALSNLVPCMVEFLSSNDWSARKASAETLTKLAIVERDVLSEFKAGCLNVFENRRFDKVKVVREVMNQMCEAWKQIPDISDGFSPPPKSQSSSSENVSDGRYPAFSQNSCSPGSVMPRLWKKSNPASRSSPDSSSVSNAKKLSFSNKRMSSGVLPKLSHKNRDVRTAVPSAPSPIGAYQGYLEERNEMMLEKNKKEKSHFSRPELKRPLLSKNSDEKKRTFGRSKAGSRVAPCDEESQDSDGISNVAKDFHRNDKDCDELALIRSQLFQIEKQQSNLLDLLERFMNSSQNGMQSLESRVHGLELSLEGLSHDLALSNRRVIYSHAPGDSCCLLPGAEILSSKLWRKTQAPYPYSQFSRCDVNPSRAAMWHRAHTKGDAETELTNQKIRLHGNGGFITNPLAEVHTRFADARQCA